MPDRREPSPAAPAEDAATGLTDVSIARCRELLGDHAESMTDQDIEDIRRRAETMAVIVIEMYQEQCRISE